MPAGAMTRRNRTLPRSVMFAAYKYHMAVPQARATHHVHKNTVERYSSHLGVEVQVVGRLVEQQSGTVQEPRGGGADQYSQVQRLDRHPVPVRQHHQVPGGNPARR